MLKESSSRKALGSTIDKKIGAELKAYSDETGIPMTKLLDKAVKMFLDSEKKDKPGK